MEEYVLPGEQPAAEETPAPHRSLLDSSRLWYAALVPLFGIYIEIYAANLTLALLVWGLALIMGPVACLLDRKHLVKRGADVSSLRPACVLLPPLYMIKRTKLTKDSPVCAIVWCVMMAYALIMNGFTSALTMDGDDIAGLIADSEWSYIEETKDVNCDRTIKETLEELSGGTLTWAGSKTDDGLSAVCADENGFGARFRLEFDGYMVGDMHLVSINMDGAVYEGESAAKLITERFDTPDSSEESSGDSSAESESDRQAA